MTTTVYLEGSTLDLAAPDGSRGGVRPDVSSLNHLYDAGHHVVLVGERVPLAFDPGLEARLARRVEALPQGASGWLISDRLETLGGAGRDSALRTVLVGPAEHREGVNRPADVVVRDLLTAVLTILADDAMGDLPSGTAA